MPSLMHEVAVGFAQLNECARKGCRKTSIQVVILASDDWMYRNGWRQWLADDPRPA